MFFSLLEEMHKKRDEYRCFAENELDEGDHFPYENLAKAAEHGYMGCPIPREWGGMGESFLSYTLLIEEISRVCASTGVIMAVHTSVGTYPILYFGSDDQKNSYLPGLARGELLGAFALTEAGAGSDAAAISTAATAVDGGYLINGCKLFITAGGEADLYLVFATLDQSQGVKGITAFLVEKSSAGLTAGKPEKKMGLNRSHTTELRMDDLFVPTGSRLGKEGEGFKIAMSLLDGGRIGISAQALGLAGAAIDFTVGDMKSREKEGFKVEQNAAFIIADLATRFEAARLLSYSAASVKQSGERCTKEASMAKMFASDLAVEAATKCLDLCRIEKRTSDSPLSRYFCDAKVTQIYEGSNQIQRIVIARELTKTTGLA